MIRHLTLANYRGFRLLEVSDLGRINLLVGTNNSGKTSVPEAVHILESVGDLSPLWEALERRGEDFDEADDATGLRRRVDIRRVFHGHQLSIGSQLTIAARADRDATRFAVEAVEQKDEDLFYYERLARAGEWAGRPEFLPKFSVLKFYWVNNAVGAGQLELRVPFTHHAGLSRDVIGLGRGWPVAAKPATRMVTTAAMSLKKIIDLFDTISLTDDESHVVRAIGAIDPSIERIATSRAGLERRRAASAQGGSRGGVVVRSSRLPDRVPIGSMGDGMWRLLGLALALVNTKGGVLLVDEIDTGLHYTVMEDMWRMVAETARRHDIQVFATTHSRDCVEALAAVCRGADPTAGREVTIQRIEEGKERAVAYSEAEIVAAADRYIEVR